MDRGRKRPSKRAQPQARAESREGAKEKTAREVLSGSVSTRGKSAMRWFDGHPKAKKFVEEWLRMRATGDTLWSAQDVLDHLHSEHGYPFQTVNGFTTFVKRQYPDLYRGAVST